jgi:DNA-directed RNA polymerase subunit M/transcription elongation factor TFIIS
MEQYDLKPVDWEQQMTYQFENSSEALDSIVLKEISDYTESNSVYIFSPGSRVRSAIVVMAILIDLYNHTDKEAIDSITEIDPDCFDGDENKNVIPQFITDYYNQKLAEESSSGEEEEEEEEKEEKENEIKAIEEIVPRKKKVKQTVVFQKLEEIDNEADQKNIEEFHNFIKTISNGRINTENKTLDELYDLYGELQAGASIDDVANIDTDADKYSGMSVYPSNRMELERKLQTENAFSTAPVVIYATGVVCPKCGKSGKIFAGGSANDSRGDEAQKAHYQCGNCGKKWKA